MRRALLLFGGCLVLLLGAVGWISWTAWRLERAEAEARRRAAVEESVRLALWRMDSAVLPLLARESEGGPLAPHVRLRFRVEADGTVRALSEGVEAEARAAELQRIVGRTPLGLVLPRAQEQQREVEDLAKSSASHGAALAQGTGDAQAYRNSQEWYARSKSLSNVGVYSPAPRVAAAAPLVPVWLGDELALARRSGEALEGSWLDWPAVRAWLLGEVGDLLPAARLEPAAGVGAGERRLAALPVRLVPGEVAVPPAKGAPVARILGVAWSAVLLAAAAVLVLLLGALGLSERRAAFVSAVTHELRTPLTTLRAYTEMLADGKIQAPEKRARYVETLHRESVRLGHLVENVLSWARIEKGRGGERTGPVELEPLFARLRERLDARAAEAGMRVVIDPLEEGLAVKADGPAVEQILFNLVDNACKYAAGATEPTIRIAAAPEANDAKQVKIEVIDQGPGLAEDARAGLFRPFSRSAQRAAGSAPGVGLGLALCRRLARAMGGELALVTGPGARFVLWLRRA